MAHRFFSLGPSIAVANFLAASEAPGLLKTVPDVLIVSRENLENATMAAPERATLGKPDKNLSI